MKKSFMEKEYTFGEFMKKFFLLVAGICLVAIIADNVAKDPVVSEKAVHVINVPHAGQVEVIYNDERYTVFVPLDVWTEEMNEFADNLMDDGAIVLKDFRVVSEERQLHPKEIYVDGEDVVALLLEKSPNLAQAATN